MTKFDVYVTTDSTIERIRVHSQGVDYPPVAVTTVNGVYKFTFEVSTDTTPALGVQVIDGVGVRERLG